MWALWPAAMAAAAAAPPPPTSCPVAQALYPAVLEVVSAVRRKASELGCTDSTPAVVAYLGGDADLQACTMQGFWGKALRLAGAHGTAFAEGRRLVPAAPDAWIG